MTSFESAHRTISALSNEFKENQDKFLRLTYQEAEVRRDFIDKFFEALGWDVYHNTQKNPYEQEVKVEKGISVGKAQKRADYAFFISPEYRVPKFFAEAKKPRKNLKNADDYFQTIRYGWNANTPIAVLTDFEELHILDCRIKPNIKNILDNPNHKSYSFEDYTDDKKFSEIYYLFSREAVADNSLEKYAESFVKGKAKRGDKTAKKVSFKAIDEDFLEYIDEVREILAKAFKKNDVKLSSEELTEATQRTIDRIVFIRFLEDKLIEPEYYISEFGKKGNAWSDFISACRKLDAKYNGIVFKKHFIDEQNFAGPEQNLFKKICDEISYLNSPYDFNAIPVHILGSIYERFLGKVVNATDKRVKVEEKPEVRKAGGVYYTPKYIVDYIVDNTVGKILRNEEGEEKTDVDSRVRGNDKALNSGKTPGEISKLRFADIACGSGSFLIGVFETLLKYHTEYYQTHPEEAKKDGCKEKDGQWVLSIKQKQRILQNNIYGVDIDQQAVEVTQLSLALKMLEDESTATANDMQVLFHEKILPDLSRNIVCGNSLIGTDILEGKMFASDEERKLNPMDFETTFPEVFKNGGFDAIVGNPPYVLINKDNLDESSMEYLLKFNVAHYKVDLFHLFMQKAIDLLKLNGKFGYIVPNPWLTLQSSFKLRKYILYNTRVKILVIFNEKVFEQADVYTAIIILDKNQNDQNTDIKVLNIIGESNILSKPFQSYKYLSSKGWKNDVEYKFETRFMDEGGELVLKILNNFPKLEDVARVSLGCQAYNSSKHTKEEIEKRIYHSDIKLSEEYLPELAGNDVSRYYIERVKGKWIKYGPWLHDYRTLDWFEGPRILVREIPASPPYQIQAAYVEDTYCNYKTILNVNPKKETNVSMIYLCCLLNSKLLSFIYPYISNKTIAKSFPRISVGDLKKLPIRNLDFSIESEKKIHDKIVEYGLQLQNTMKQLRNVKTEKDKLYFKRKCEIIDIQLDTTIIGLYGLNKTEIKLINGNENF